MLSKQKDTLLIVGNKNSSRTQIREIFINKYNLLEAENIEQAALLLKHNRDYIILSILDINLKNRKAFQKFMNISGANTEENIPVIVVSNTIQQEDEEFAYLIGVLDVISHSLSNLSMEKRIQVIIDVLLQKINLEKMINEQNKIIRKTNQTILDTLSTIIEYRSTESGNHVLRIRQLTRILLEEIAINNPEYELTENIIDIITGASALHDIGKISIPDAILNKPGPLTKEEFDIIKTHTTIGSQLITHLEDINDELFLRYAYNICLYHHERWDGNGYPSNLSGDDIPICAQVVGIADAFDALTTNRVYKPAFSYDKSINMIINGECGIFSPKLIECFKHVKDKLIDAARFYADGNSPKNDYISVPLPAPNWNNTSTTLFQKMQSKYQAMLYYSKDTVLELDIDNGLCHVVYNPDYNIRTDILSTSFEKIFENLKSTILHTDDYRIADEIVKFISEEFKILKIRRRSFKLRLFDDAISEYVPYIITFINTSNAANDNNIITVVLHKTDTNIHVCSKSDSSYSAADFYGLSCATIKCNADNNLTIVSGIETLSYITSYSKEEMENNFKNSLVNIIHPDDIDGLFNNIKSASKHGYLCESEFRIKTKLNKYVWVLSKSRIVTDESGNEYFCSAIYDNTKQRAIREDLENNVIRNQILIDYSGGIVFDWNLDEDTMYCSQKWEELFGYKPVSKNYGTNLGIATHFHPDDLPYLRDAIATLKADTSTFIRDVRIADNNRTYIWTRITATSMRSRDGKINRIIGIIQNIDELKKLNISLSEESQLDSLTKLYNNRYVHVLSDAYLSEKSTAGMDCLLVIDLDNFKNVNDTLGHMYGDGILKLVSDTLRSMFRSNDIIGRIGGDEFVVFLKDVPSDNLINERCSLLVENLREKFNRLMPDLNVSCSIGVSVSPIHGTTYNELFACADKALYTAKFNGKNQYYIYDDSKALASARTVNHTRIESNENSDMMSFERFVFNSLYESKNIDKTINDLLVYVGTNFNISRVYIFENNDDNTACSNTFEWCNDGITPEKDNLQNVSYITDIPGWPNVYDEKGILYCTDITKLAPQFREILEPQNIKSMLQCAIMDKGQFRGYIGFDECNHNRLWTKEHLRQLEFIAQALSIFLINHRDFHKHTENKK